MDVDLTNSILLLAALIGFLAIIIALSALGLIFALREINRTMADLKQMSLHIPETFRGAAKEIRQLSHHISALHGLNPTAVQSVRERADKLAKEFEDGADEAEKYIADAGNPTPQNPPPAQAPATGGETGNDLTAGMQGAGAAGEQKPN
jgi:hypothetical protein